MGFFSRLTDIINANLNSMLDRAEDPEKTVQLIIQEMEDTLVEVRSSAVKSIAEKKDLARRRTRFEAEARDWQEKAELALRKDREELARAALIARRKVESEADLLKAQLDEIDQVLASQQDDIASLQAKLDEAKARRQALSTRAEAAQNRLRMRVQIHSDRTTDAMSRFERMERQLDEMEGRVEAVGIGRDGARSLADQFAALETDSVVEEELARLKAELDRSRPPPSDAA